MTKPNGMVVVGEPYWLMSPDPAYLKAAGFERNSFGTHYENVLTGQELGLALLHTFVSNHDEWDTYEGLNWYAAENYALTHPEDSDVPDLLKRIRDQKHEYLQWGRDTLGWAIYMFRKVG